MTIKKQLKQNLLYGKKVFLVAIENGKQTVITDFHLMPYHNIIATIKAIKIKK